MHSARSPFVSWPREPSCPSTPIRRAMFESFQNVTRPGSHTLFCLADNALRLTVNSLLVSRPGHPARRSRFEGHAEMGWSMSVRSADVARLRPTARTETPAVPVVPGDLDTLRAWAVAASDVRSAFLLVGIRDRFLNGHEGTDHGSQQGEERWRPTPRASIASRTRCSRR
jgi:hypothetical protein